MAALEVRQHGVYAEALRAHLRPLATIAGLGTIFRSSGIARFVQGGVVKNLPLSVTDELTSRKIDRQR